MLLWMGFRDNELKFSKIFRFKHARLEGAPHSHVLAVAIIHFNKRILRFTLLSKPIIISRKIKNC